mmetsp:Transcript_15987/g.30095  ORF Transcript_15987/g.30095 Transcript_15987/m.30095 type:complete len:260 (+) Transcript_15987:62-841(+)
MGHGLSIQCCQQEQFKRCDAELRTSTPNFHVCDVDKEECFPERVYVASWAENSNHSAQLIVDDGQRVPEVPEPLHMQSLSYSPVKYEECDTIDTSRSQERYSNALVHTARMNTRRQLLDRQAWLNSAIQGRYVMLLQTQAEVGAPMSRVPTKYYLDHNHASLSFCAGGPDAVHVVIMMEAIQGICSLADSMMLMTQWELRLTDMEKSCGVLLRYRSHADTKSVSHDVCFLEESEAAKDMFIHILTVLWLEKPQPHSVWF